MLNRPLRRLALAVAGSALLALSVTGTPTATADSTGPVTGPAHSAPVLHRIVWTRDDANQLGIHMYSQNVDGTDAHRIYNSHHGWTLDLIPDRKGRHVAFSPCCRTTLPLLVVVPVNGGSARTPLAHHTHAGFYAVGAIGWSPSGRRLAFTGFTTRGGHLHAAIYTIRPNGHGLHKYADLNFNRAARAGGGQLPWTHEGILYSDLYNLLLVHHDRTSKVLLHHVVDVRISGDLHHIVTWHEHGTRRDSIWYGKPDGTDQRRIYLFPKDLAHGASYFDVTPNHDGTQLLATTNLSEIVTWNAGDDPSTAAPVPAHGHAWYPATWN